MLPSKYDDENICVTIKVFLEQKDWRKKGELKNERFILVHVENNCSINRMSEANEEVP